MEITIRAAERGDLEAFLALWRTLQEVQGAYRILRIDRDPDQHFAGEFTATIGQDGHAWLAAVAGAQVVAMAHLHVEKPSRVSDEQVLEMSRVVVAPEWRGKGVGKLLVAQAQRIARDRGLRYLSARIFSSNERAMDFWDGLGFRSFMDTRFLPVEPQ